MCTQWAGEACSERDSTQMRPPKHKVFVSEKMTLLRMDRAIVGDIDQTNGREILIDRFRYSPLATHRFLRLAELQ